MEIERRERDPDTGEIIGAGFGDVFGKIVAKLTGKTAKKLATKAAEKLVEKGAEKLGKKLANLLVKRFMKNFNKASSRSRPQRANASRIPQRSAANKRKRNWKNVSGFAAPFGRCCEQTNPSRSEATQKQISKDK